MLILSYRKTKLTQNTLWGWTTEPNKHSWNGCWNLLPWPASLCIIGHTTSLTCSFIILPPALTSHTDLFISKIHNTHSHLRTLLFCWAGILIFPFIVWVSLLKSQLLQEVFPDDLPHVVATTLPHPMPPVTMALPSFIFFVAVAFNGNDTICFFACFSTVFLLSQKLAESRDLAHLTHPSIISAQKSSSHSNLSINI